MLAVIELFKSFKEKINKRKRISVNMRRFLCVRFCTNSHCINHVDNKYRYTNAVEFLPFHCIELNTGM